jgi:chromosome segregation ATPase
VSEEAESQTKRTKPMQHAQVIPSSSKSGWDPVIVLLVGALIVSIILSFYGLTEAVNAKSALKSISSTSNVRATEFAQNLAAQKRRIEELDVYKAKAEEREKLQALEIKTLHDELTNTKHSLHEEETRARRLHRDNVELHKKLQVKSSELKVLEDQTHLFEAEMSKLTKSIHTLQGDVQQQAEAADDYEQLFKKQKEQKERMEAAQGAAGNADAKATETAIVEGVHLSKTDIISNGTAAQSVEAKESSDSMRRRARGKFGHKHQAVGGATKQR